MSHKKISKTLSAAEGSAFCKKIKEYYRKNKRAMPWRETSDPYKIFVSEVMLQQTQVDRVREKYVEFLEEFPTPAALARASVAEVIRVWKGLGYNRRALNLKRAMEIVVREHDGKIPRTVEALDALPGIGHATAAAIAAYAFGFAEPFIETNVRSVFIDGFFKNAAARGVTIHDDELMPLVAATLDRKNPRDWYYALMDYGTMLKRTRVNPSRASKHHMKQKKFEGSDRQLRGKILEVYLKLRQKGTAKVSRASVVRALADYEKGRVEKLYGDLKQEGFY